MTDKRKLYVLRAMGIVLMLLIGGVFYYLFSPEEASFFPKCPFYAITGLQCPGCGSQRAIHHLLHFDLKNAFLSNSLLVIAIPYILIGIYAEYFGGKERHPKLKAIFYSKNIILFILVSIIAFWIGRNLI
ncbi:MAG: DUF2752 domain-containing protein [Prevotella sp.]|nr:DUF2752 domain-containing protein [Prevotella sp.]